MMRAFDAYRIWDGKEITSLAAETTLVGGGQPYTLYEPRKRDNRNKHTSGTRWGLPRRTMDPSIGMKMAVGIYVVDPTGTTANWGNANTTMTFRLTNGSTTTTTSGATTIDAAVTGTASVVAKIRKTVATVKLTNSTTPEVGDFNLENYGPFVITIPEGTLGERYLDLEVNLKSASAGDLKISLDAFYAPLDSFSFDTGDAPIPRQVLVG